jgi:hypothetical protein
MESNGTASGDPFLTLKVLKTKNIQIEFKSTYGLEALAVLMVKKWQRCFQQGRMDQFDNPKFGRPLTNDLGETIGFMLADKPFSSCKVLCRHIRIGKVMCLRILHGKHGFKTFYLHSVPHAVLLNQQSEKVKE